MRAWLTAAAIPVLLIAWCRVPLAEEDKDIYLWKDRAGKTHLSEEPPEEGGSVQERITPAPDPPPAAVNRRMAVKAAENERRQDAYERCRLADQTRQFALTARRDANALKSRAADARRDARDLKERVGYDDEDLADRAGRQAGAADRQARGARCITMGRWP